MYSEDKQKYKRINIQFQFKAMSGFEGAGRGSNNPLQHMEETRLKEILSIEKLYSKFESSIGPTYFLELKFSNMSNVSFFSD